MSDIVENPAILAPRDARFLKLLADGRTGVEIGHALGVSASWSKRRRAQLVAAGIEVPLGRCGRRKQDGAATAPAPLTGDTAKALDEEIIRLVGEGRTRGQIAAYLGIAYTIVQGRTRRLGLEVEEAVGAAPTIKLDRAPKPLAPELLAAFVAPARASPLLLFDALRGSACRWPFDVAGETGPEIRFCGEAIDPGSSYCRCHRRLSRRLPRPAGAPETFRVPMFEAYLR